MLESWVVRCSKEARVEEVERRRESVRYLISAPSLKGNESLIVFPSSPVTGARVIEADGAPRRSRSWVEKMRIAFFNSSSLAEGRMTTPPICGIKKDDAPRVPAIG